MPYSYWNEYQKAQKKVKELEELLEMKTLEIQALNTQIQQLICSCDKSKMISEKEKINQYKEEIKEKQEKINQLEELLYKCNHSQDDRKTAVHTRVIEAINKAFED